ncbi:hypothetical protein BH23GEM4_BH23GEM4_23180 [soil metagenome]
MSDSRCGPEGHCVTCSDEGIPMRVVAPGADPGLAICQDDAGEQSEVMTGVVGPVGVGDVLLVHAGTALLRLEAAA